MSLDIQLENRLPSILYSLSLWGFAFPPCVCMGFLLVLHVPPFSEQYAVEWIDYFFPRYECVCVLCPVIDCGVLGVASPLT